MKFYRVRQQCCLLFFISTVLTIFYHWNMRSNSKLPRIDSSWNDASSSWVRYPDKDMLIRREAFLDFRDNKPAIVINTMKNDRNRFLPKLFVKVTYDTSLVICQPLKKFDRSGHYKYPIILDEPPSYYVNYLWRTTGQLPLNATPQYMQITLDHKCISNLSQKLLIYISPKQEKVKFGLCLHQPLFGNIKTQDIIDWIVIHKIMGVQTIYIYLENEPNDFMQSVKPFVDQGLVKIVYWSIGVETLDYGQRGLINDCLYRSMNEVEYLAMYDLDEIFVPRGKKPLMNWDEFFTPIEAAVDLTKYAAFAFLVRQWHDSKTPLIVDTNTPCPNFTLPVYLRRSFVTDTTHTYESKNKLIIRPKALYSCSVHGTMLIRPGKRKIYHVPQAMGFVHHYRSREHPFTSLTYDPVMKKYANQVFKRICDLKQHDSMDSKILTAI